MKTQQEATYLVASALVGGSISDDSPFPKRRLLNKLKIVLAQLKQRNLVKGMEFTQDDLFVLDCIKLEEVDRVSCPTIPPSGLVWKKSINPIPSFIKIISVTDILANTTIPVLVWDKLTYHSKSRIKRISTSPAATFRSTNNGTYLYVLTTNTVISATVVPMDYMDYALLPRCDESSKFICDFWDIPIGCSDTLLSEAIQFLVTDEIKTASYIKPDNINNSNPA